MAAFPKLPSTGTAIATVLSAIAGVTSLSGQQAIAACNPLSPPQGGTITCDTSAPNPETGDISIDGETDLTLDVQPGAIFSPSASLTGLPERSLISNEGTIIGDFIMSDDARIENSGTMNGSFQLSGTADTVINAGTIDTSAIDPTFSDGYDLFGGDDTFTVTDGGTVIGTVRMGFGDDVFTLDDGGTVDGTIDAGGNDDAGDTLQLTGSGTVGGAANFLNFENLSLADGGDWSFAPGSLDPIGSLTVGAGSLSLPDGISASDGTIAAGGSVVFGGTASFSSNLTSFGEVVVDGTLNASVLDLQPGSRLEGMGDVFASVGASGTLAPGSSVGTLTINGSLLLESTSTLEIEFTGDPVTSDQLLVSGTTTITDGATLRFIELGDSGTGSFDFLISDGGITGNFTNVEGTLVDLTREIELVTTSPTTLSAVISLADGDTLISDAPYNPVNGSPSSLLQDMSNNDFWSGVDSIGGTEINFDYTSLTQDGVDIDVFKLPVRHTFDLPETDMQLVVQAPFAYATIEDDIVYSQQFGGALRIPVTENWEVTPAVRVGGVYSDDFSSEAIGYGGAVTSRFQFTLGDYTVLVGNHVGYYRAQDVDLFLDESINYDTQNVLLRNGIIVDGPVPMFGETLDVQAFVVDTRNFGDDLFVDSYIDIGASANLADLIGYPVRFGAKGTFGENTTGFSLNTGYRF